MAGSDPGYRSRERGRDIDGLIDAIAADPGRHIPMSAALNFRDVGGYPVSGGGTIAWRTLLRSDAPRRLDDAAADMLASLNLRTVLDLRTSTETQIAPSPLDGLAECGTLTMHVSLVGEDFTALPDELGGIYQFMVDSRGAEIGAAVRSLARPGGLPGLVHCTAGKDRTGIVVALVLASVGVPDQFIAADYALTSRYLDPRHIQTIGGDREGSATEDPLMASPPELILGVLGRARQHAGTIEGYLAGHGVTASDLRTLRAALVTAGASDQKAGEPDGPR